LTIIDGHARDRVLAEWESLYHALAPHAAGVQ
jgi:hypothetical protein